MLEAASMRELKVWKAGHSVNCQPINRANHNERVLPCHCAVIRNCMCACCHLDSSCSSRYSAASMSPPRGMASSCTAVARSAGTCTTATTLKPETRHANTTKCWVFAALLAAATQPRQHATGS